MPLVCLCVNWREGSRKAVLSVTRYHTETSNTVTCCHLLTFTPLKAWQMLGRQSFSISINKLVSIINQTYPACQSLRSSKELTYQPTDGWIQRDLDLLAYYIRTGFCFLQIMPFIQTSQMYFTLKFQWSRYYLQRLWQSKTKPLLVWRFKWKIKVQTKILKRPYIHLHKHLIHIIVSTNIPSKLDQP